MGKFLQEGADFMDAAVDWENEKNRVHGKYAGTPLQESTLKNLMSLQDVPENSKIIGKFLSNTYSEETFNLMIKGLKEGFVSGKDTEKFEDDEKERIGKLFEDYQREKAAKEG